MVTVVEFHSVSDGIQQCFASSQRIFNRKASRFQSLLCHVVPYHKTWCEWLWTNFSHVYLVRQLSLEPLKIRHFQFSKPNFKTKDLLNLPKNCICIKILFQENKFCNNLFNFVNFQTNFILEMYQIFDNHDLGCLTSYQKILSEGSLECKNLINSTRFNMKFHNCHHATQRHRNVFEHTVENPSLF